MATFHFIHTQMILNREALFLVSGFFISSSHGNRFPFVRIFYMFVIILHFGNLKHMMEGNLNPAVIS